VYVGNLSYDVKYRDLIEFMRGGGWGRYISGWPLLPFLVMVVMVVATATVVAVGRWEKYRPLEGLGTESESGAGVMAQGRR
jgi:hypothetical protein